MQQISDSLIVFELLVKEKSALTPVFFRINSARYSLECFTRFSRANITVGPGEDRTQDWRNFYICFQQLIQKKTNFF